MDAEQAKRQMLERDIKGRGITDASVLRALLAVPREAFVPEKHKRLAYGDRPLPIGEGQTISQPYIVALMVSELGLNESAKVLEVGAGSGYAAAVLGEIAADVYGVERIKALAERAAETLKLIGADNVHVKHGDGTEGWREHAPYDAILVSAGGAELPPALLEQLAPGGRLIMPVGGKLGQELVRVDKSFDGELSKRSLGGARFVPLISEAS